MKWIVENIKTFMVIAGLITFLGSGFVIAQNTASTAHKAYKKAKINRQQQQAHAAEAQKQINGLIQQQQAWQQERKYQEEIEALKKQLDTKQ